MSKEKREMRNYRPPKDAQELLKRYAAGERYFAHASLPMADLSGAGLVEANLQGANLIETTFRDADLRSANFQGANLRGSDLQKAKLLNTKLRDADLQDANLAETTGLLAGQLGGANVCGAKLPGEIRNFDGLKSVEEVSKHAGNLLFSLLLACVYSWLTIATTTDALLLTNSISSPLPIIGTAVPIVAFYLAAPLFLLGLYTYLHLNLQRLWEGLAELPAIFPDGRPLDKKAYPWLLNSLVCVHLPRLKKYRPPLSRVQVGISVFIAWWLGPLTILLFWGRYIRRHDWLGTILLVVLLTASIGGAIMLRALAAGTLRGQERKPRSWKKAWNGVRSYKDAALLLGVSVVFYLFYLLSFGAIYGIRPDFVSGNPDSPLTSNLKSTDPRVWVPRAFALLGYSPFADLREVDVSFRPPNWTGRKEDEIALVKRARLRGKNLRYADAYRAFLVGADLNGADLQGAYLFQANLRGADLMWADLQEVFLSETDLQAANLQKADLRGADLSGANLRQTRMEGSILTETNLEGTDLRSAILTDAIGLTRKQIELALIDEKTRLPNYLGRPRQAKLKQ